MGAAVALEGRGSVTRRPPDILGVVALPGGGLEVRWGTDTFFGDSEDPERVLVALNGQVFDTLDGDETSATIDAEQVTSRAPGVLTIGIIYWWSGSPEETQQAAVQIPLSGAPGAGQADVDPAKQPEVGVAVEPRTPTTPLRLRVTWTSHNYNDGEIVWGPQSAPEQHRHSIRPRGTVYHGTWTTDQPVAPQTLYRASVRVRNTLHSPTWLSTSAWVRTPDAVLSVRAFLIAGRHAPAAGLRSAMGAERSVHRWLAGA